jgi:hypothetical protein
MDTLAWLLKLEWIEDMAAGSAGSAGSATTAPAAPPPAPQEPPLPPDLQSDITRLARFGDGAGLRKLLADAQASHPQSRGTLQALDAAAQRFDFPLILESLGPAGPADH